MLRWTWLGTTTLLAAAAIWISGCGAPPAVETGTGEDVNPAAAEHDHEHDHEGHDHDHEGHDQGGQAGSSKIEANLAKLSPQDRQLAEQQKICPVSGEPLGSMGTPKKVQLEGDKSIFICCAGCDEEVRSNPDKYLAKLEEQQ